MRVVELAGPSDDDFLHTARVVAVSLGSQAGLDADSCDEIRVAVDEACGALRMAGCARLLISFNLHDHIEVTVRSSSPQPFTLDMPSRLVMSALMDRLDVDGQDGSIHLVKRLG